VSAARVSWLSLVLLAAGCALSAEGELPEIEVTQHGLRLPGVPRELRTGEVSVVLSSFMQPKDRLGLPTDSYRSVKVKGATVTLTRGGGGDLSFVHNLSITVNGLQGFLAGVAPVEAAHYERASSGAAGSSIDLHNGGPVEVVDAWRDPTTVLTVEAVGDLPEEPWTVDVTVRVSALLQY